MPDPFDLSAQDDRPPIEGADFDRPGDTDGYAAPTDQGAAGWPFFHPDLAEPEAPEVDEAAVRQWLDLAGAGLNFTLPGRKYGLDDAWRMTQRDLDEIAPPLCRIVNRHPALRAVATRADVDALTVAFGFGRYAFRNLGEVAEARREAEGERPHLGGRPPEEPAGPRQDFATPGFGRAVVPANAPGLTGVPTL